MNRPAPWGSLNLGLIERRPLRIGGATIDPVSRNASWRGGHERLQPQILKVLLILAGRRGEVVTRDELVQLCWGGRIVGDDVINRAIFLLRHLAERAGGFEIETVPRTGYRLMETASPKQGRRRRWIVAGSAIATFAVIAGFFLLVRHPAVSERPTLTVMVVPFTADPNDAPARQLAADVHDSVVRMLAESVSVKVADNGPSSAQTTADLVVSGEIARSAQQLLAKVRVEDPARHAIVMFHQLKSDSGDATDLPDQVGANVASALSWTGPLIQLDERHPSDPAFITLLLDQVGDEDFDGQRAYEFAQRNAPKALDSAIAQLVLAMDTGMAVPDLPQEERASAVSVALPAADRALRLAPHFGDVYIPWCLLHPPVLMRECENHLRAGLMADPKAPFVGSFLGHLMQKVGRTDEAVSLAQTTLAEDQYVPGKIAGMLGVLEADGDSREADMLYRRGIRLWPHSHFLFWRRVAGITERGDLDALQRLEREVGPNNLPPQYESVSALAKAVKARSLAGVKASCPTTPNDLKSVQCMLAMARLGDLDDAFALGYSLYPRRLGRTPAEEQALWFQDPRNLDTAFLTGTGAAPLRRDPRYLALAERVGLLDYWRSGSGSGRLPDFCTKWHEAVCANIRAVSRRAVT